MSSNVCKEILRQDHVVAFTSIIIFHGERAKLMEK